ncbi:type II toxin-antitoxin system antitoxin DNA ADP-ribosyl glycohydrolase DarG [Thermus sediminis]|uniref:type II toxin-antitoxin system antitoxin DNA ADP-ribosyl glycohydrolase DarG n=1 Tax=Thermus sediminis TaxID=1761908 RepID=UPI000E3C8954|nr:macro domain-containing protein [Thermus sediminis]
MLCFVRGNLLDAPVEALVNTVNTVGVMGKGVALQFKRAFPDNYQAYVKACRRGEVQIGRIFVHDRGPLVQPRYIFNFPTKKHWRHPSRMEYIEEGLKDLVRQIQKLEVRSIALPPLGAGNGGLPWTEVRRRIQEALEPLKGVEIWVYEPAEDPKAHPITPLKAKPPLTPARAALLKLFWLYGALREPLGRLEAQKLAYFLQEAGLDLRLAFVRKQFGPYAEPLNHVLARLEGHYIQGFGDRTGASQIHLGPQALNEAVLFLADHPRADEAATRAAEWVKGFETPYGLELLATVHWAVRHEAARDWVSLQKGLQAWSPRKATFPKTHLQVALDALLKRGALRPEEWRDRPPKLPANVAQEA